MGKMKDISIEAEEQGQNSEDYWLEMSLKQKGDGSGQKVLDDLSIKQQFVKPEIDDPASF